MVAISAWVASRKVRSVMAGLGVDETIRP